jgi:hypothetical protein
MLHRSSQVSFGERSDVFDIRPVAHASLHGKPTFLLLLLLLLLQGATWRRQRCSAAPLTGFKQVARSNMCFRSFEKAYAADLAPCIAIVFVPARRAATARVTHICMSRQPSCCRLTVMLPGHKLYSMH